MRDRCFRHALLLSVVCLLLSCSDTRNSELVIEACLDQDGNPVPPGVTVSVEGVSAIWNGTPLRFPVQVEGAVRLVRVKAGAGSGYAFNSKSQYAVEAGRPTQATLRFFRPYRIRVDASGRETPPLARAHVFANGYPIGTTDEHGRFTWQIDGPDTRAGTARVGARFDIRLEGGGQHAAAAPVILARDQFAYTAEAYLGREHVAPAYSFAAEAAAATHETPDALPPTGPTLTSNRRPARTAPPPASRPSSDPSGLITEARPRPPAFEPANQPPPNQIAGLDPATPAPSEPPLSPLEQGDRAFAAGQYTEARRLYVGVPPDHPDFKRARQKLGEIHLETKNYEGAIAAFQDILRQDPSEYAAYNNLAAVYLATESYAEALANLDEVLARKHLIPKNKRLNAELEVRYTRASIQYIRFQNERDVITKKEQGLLAMSVLQAFIDRLPPGDQGMLNKRREMQDKLDDIRRWVRKN